MLGKLGDLANLMKNAKSLQDNFENAQKEMESAEITGEAGAGLAKVTLNGKFAAIKTELDPELLKESKEVIEEIITAAYNSAAQKVTEMTKSTFSGLSEAFEGELGKAE